MNRRFVVFASLLVLPGVAVAQRGGGGKSRATEHDQMFGKDDQPKGPTIRVRDIEDLSPIHRLIDKRKDIKLRDDQVDALKKSDDALKKKNEPLMKAVDSLVREMRPPMNMTPEAASRIDDAGAALREAMKTVNENYEAAAKEAMAGFDADQQAKANEVLAKLKEDADKFMREKMGRGGRRG